MPPVDHRSSLQASEPLDGKALREISESFRAEVLSFESLRGRSFSDIVAAGSEEPLGKLLQDISALTRTTMEAMNASFPGLPPDSPERTLELLSARGAKTVVLKGVLPGSKERQLLGYGVIILGPENIPDPEHIPAELRTKPSTCRIIRLFVSEPAREYLPRGEAFSQVIDEIRKLVGEGPSIGMVLTNITPRTPLADSSKTPARWLDALTAHVERGFDKTDFHVREAVPQPDGTVVDIDFTLFTWPPQSAEAIKRLLERTARFEYLEQHSRERVAWAASAMPALGGRVLVESRSGPGFDLAKLYPGNLVLEVQHKPADERLRVERRPNLITEEYRDAAVSPFGSGQVNVAFLSGVLPDAVAGSSENPYQAASKFLAPRVAQLQRGGTLIIRDTVKFEIPNNVMLTLSTAPNPRTGISSADAFRSFTQTCPEPHLRAALLGEVNELRCQDGFCTFLAPASLAAEFILKWPWHKSWQRERLRPYSALGREDHESLVSENGLRLILSAAEHSAWIEKHFRSGQAVVSTLSGTPLADLPSNWVTIAEKVGDEDGVRIIQASQHLLTLPSFVTVKTYGQINSTTGRLVATQEVASRPNLTHDVIPYSIRGNQLFIVGREMPRPIISIHPIGLDGSKSGAYLTEQVTAIVPTDVLEDPTRLANSARQIAAERAGISGAEILHIDPPITYFVRPDAVDEMVAAQPIEVSESLQDRSLPQGVYNLRTQPRVRTFEGTALLQGCQVGTIQDGRLERMVYQIMHRHGLSRGAWLGQTLELSPQDAADLPIGSAETTLSPISRSPFQQMPPGTRLGFFDIQEGKFQELDRHGDVVGDAKLEYIAPSKSTGLGLHAVSVLPCALKAPRSPGEKGEVLVGLEVRDYAAVQARTGSASLSTIPTFRMPDWVTSRSDASAWVLSALKRYFEIMPKGQAWLGGKYRTSPGISPETIDPLIVEVDLASSKAKAFNWVPLRELRDHAHLIRCAQLATAVQRAAHMFKL